jgi:hypothetical protein
MRFALATLTAFSILIGSIRPAAAFGATLEAPVRQVPDVRPFSTAHFEFVGTAKYDGITIDILGEGDLAPPDRQRSSFKFGPFTAEIIQIGGTVFTRTRFDRAWSRQEAPEVITVGPISSSDVARLERSVRLVGTEMVGDVAAEHYTAAVDLSAAVQELAELGDARTRRALETLQGSVDVWVGAQDRRVRQERLLLSLTLPSIEPEGDDAPASLDLTIAYSRLDQTVAIDQPVRNDPTPISSPRPTITQVTGPPGSPTPQSRPAPPARAPVQIPSR